VEKPQTNSDTVMALEAINARTD